MSHYAPPSYQHSHQIGTDYARVCVCVSVYVLRVCTHACYMYNSLATTLPNTCTLLFMPKYIDSDDFQRVSVLFVFPPYYSQRYH